MKQRLRDEENALFSNDEYATFLWGTVKNRQRQTVRARLHDTQLYLYSTACYPCGGDLWGVRINAPTAGEEYRVNEASGVVFCVQGLEARDDFEISGTVANVDIALFNALEAAAANPAKAAVYLQSNGFVVDARDASEQIRTYSQHILGVR